MASSLLSDYLIYDVIANRPATPSVASHVTVVFLATDTGAAYLWSGSTWVVMGGGGGGTWTTASAALGADVAMTTANTYYDGPSVSLVAGTWDVTVGVTLLSAGGDNMTYKLWDGTTVRTSQETTLNASQYLGVTLGARFVLGSTSTVKLSVASALGGATMKATAPNNGAGATACWICAVAVI